MLTDVLFPAELQLRVDGFEMEKDTVNIWLTSTNGRSVCPHCQTISERIHSSYNRHPTDLPLADYTVRLDMAVHRFFCDNGDCGAKTFTERIPAFIQHYGHRTNRLASKQQKVAFEVGGESGKRLLIALDMPASSDTILRLVHNAPEYEVKTPRRWVRMIGRNARDTHTVLFWWIWRLVSQWTCCLIEPLNHSLNGCKIILALRSSAVIVVWSI